MTAKISSDIQGAVRARLGYAWNRLLFYGAGGVALAKFNLQSNLTSVMPDPNPANFFTYPDSLFYYAAAKDRSTTQVGWTLGGGLEYAVNSNWSVRAEYRYSDFGHIAETPSFLLRRHGILPRRPPRDPEPGAGRIQLQFAAPDPEPAPGNLIVKGPTVGASLPLPSSAGAPPKAPTPAVPLVVDWTGFYVGGQTGYAYGDNHSRYSYEAPGLTTTLPSSGALIGDAQGVIVGAHLGYNLEFDKWLVGFEGEVDGTSLIRRNQLNLNDPALGTNIGVLSTLVQSDIQGSIRGRAGYSFGRLLTFVTGGVALADFSLQSPTRRPRHQCSGGAVALLRHQGASVDDARGLDCRRRPRMGGQQQLVRTRRISLHGFRKHARHAQHLGDLGLLLFRPASPRPKPSSVRLQLQIWRGRAGAGHRQILTHCAAAQSAKL